MTENATSTHRPAGAGSLFQRADGRWQAALQVNGKRRVVYGKTRTECYAKLQALQRVAHTSGDLPNPGTYTVGDLLAYWLATTKSTLKPRTIADYEQTCTLYLIPTLGAVRLTKLTPSCVQGCYAGLQARGLVRGAAKTHAVLHRACKLGVLWGWLPHNPCDRVVKPAYHAPRKNVWSAWELNAFLQGAKEHWLYPLWVVAIASGCRLGELCALTWADVDLRAGTIRIDKTLHHIGSEWVVTTPKTRSGRRDLALPAEGVEALRTQQVQQNDWRARAGDGWQLRDLVFTRRNGAPLYESAVAYGLTTTCERLGLTAVTAHGLRHLHASLLLGEGLPIPVVSARLGHANPHITLQVYAHVVGKQDGAAAEAIGRALAQGR